MSFSISNYDWPAFPGLTPFDHQKTTTAFLLSHKRAYVFNEMGTGKTLSALWACDILLKAQKIRRILVISPLSTITAVWMTELMRHLPHRRCGVAHGTSSYRQAVIANVAYEFVIINHDGIKIVEDDIVRAGFDIIIIDELTAYKAHSDRTKCMMRIAKSARAVWGMTGDLTPNAPTEAFYPCKIVNPNNQYLPKYFGQFRDACMYQLNEMVWLPKEIAPQIVGMVAQPAIRFTRAQCLDLPPTTYQHMELPISAEQRRYYDILKAKAYLATESGDISAVNAGVMLNKLLQISAGAVKNDDGQIIEIGCPERISALVEIFEQTPQRKLIVFATFRATIAMLQRELTNRGILTETIYGDVPQKVRSSHIDRFQRGDLNVLVLQPQSSAHGITLVAASTIVWFSLIPSNELFEQGNARIARPGQTRNTHIIMFQSTSAEKHIAKILHNKGEMSRETLRMFKDHML